MNCIVIFIYDDVIFEIKMVVGLGIKSEQIFVIWLSMQKFSTLL